VDLFVRRLLRLLLAQITSQGTDGRILKHLCNRKRGVEPRLQFPMHSNDHQGVATEVKEVINAILSTPKAFCQTVAWFVPSPFGRRIGETRED